MSSYITLSFTSGILLTGLRALLEPASFRRKLHGQRTAFDTVFQKFGRQPNKKLSVKCPTTRKEEKESEKKKETESD